MTDVAVQPAPEVVLYKIPEVMRMLRMSRGALYQEMSAGRLRAEGGVIRRRHTEIDIHTRARSPARTSATNSPGAS